MKFLALLLCLIVLSAPAQAFDYDDFKTLPVLHDGRIKPLDSFARHHLMVFSGKDRHASRPAIDWLAQTLFDPGTAAEEDIFIIRHPLVLGLREDERVIS